MANRLVIAPAPHVHGSESTQKIMRDVLLALTPALIFSIVVFGWSALMVTCVSVASCVLFEFLIQKFLLRGPRTIGDLSAVVTGVLLAFNVPASLPWWIVVIGAFVSIAIAKMTFGGLGKNPFNPALVGRVFLLSMPSPALHRWLPSRRISFHTRISTSRISCSDRSPVRWAKSPRCF